MQLDIMSLGEAWEAFNWFVAIGLFLLYMIVEWLDSGLTLMITRHESIKSASTTMILYLILGIEILALVSNYLYIIPTALGAFVGVYLLLEHEKKVRPINKS
jgi:uncharacterized membrane protein